MPDNQVGLSPESKQTALFQSLLSLKGLKFNSTEAEESCITGNVPSSLLEIGTVDEVKSYVKRLIDTCAKNGGYIMMNGATVENIKPENFKAMINTTKEYGVY
jgi:uroporphyrinogen-III decarboxylase